MLTTLSAELINGVFGDPALYLDLRYAKRALLFDAGELGKLLPKRILRLSDAYVTDIRFHADNEARVARAKRVVPFHFSPRYLGREEELRAELNSRL